MGVTDFLRRHKAWRCLSEGVAGHCAECFSQALWKQRCVLCFRSVGRVSRYAQSHRNCVRCLFAKRHAPIPILKVK